MEHMQRKEKRPVQPRHIFTCIFGWKYNQINSAKLTALAEVLLTIIISVMSDTHNLILYSQMLNALNNEKDQRRSTTVLIQLFTWYI